MTLRIVDLSAPPEVAHAAGLTGPVVAVGSMRDASQFWLENATFSLTRDNTSDRRVITVASLDVAVDELTARLARWPQAGAVCDDVLRAVDAGGPALAGIVTESLAYSTLQSGPEFARWLDDRGPAQAPELPTRCCATATTARCASC